MLVYAFGIFDLFHYGHLESLRQAKELGDYLIVGVLSDEAATLYKRESVIPIKERMAIVEHCDYVDEVIKLESTDPTENIKAVQPDIVVHGDDWVKDFRGSGGQKVVLTKYYQGQSTTEIIRRINEHFYNHSCL